MDDKPKIKIGRKPKYIEGIHDAWAKSLSMEGLIDKEIAKRMGIAESTFNKWKKDFPLFSESIKMGKEPADAQVKLSLFKRANGYVEKQKKVVVEIDKDGNQKPARIETTDLHIAPDVGAICFWLKNRLPDEWRDKKEVDLSMNPFEELMKSATSKEND